MSHPHRQWVWGEGGSKGGAAARRGPVPATSRLRKARWRSGMNFFTGSGTYMSSVVAGGGPPGGGVDWVGPDFKIKKSGQGPPHPHWRNFFEGKTGQDIPGRACERGRASEISLLLLLLTSLPTPSLLPFPQSPIAPMKRRCCNSGLADLVGGSLYRDRRFEPPSVSTRMPVPKSSVKSPLRCG